MATRWQLVERARFAPKRRWEDGFPNLRLESRPEMNERWLPVLAAALGFFGGVAGAAVGGYVANEGQERRFEAERAARLRVLRTEAYRTFLRAAEREREDYNRDNTLLYAASNEVALVAGSKALGPAAAQLVAVFDKDLSEDEFQKRRQTFIDLAKADLGS